MAQPTITEVGRWSEDKVDILREYATAYSKIMAKHEQAIRRRIYIDGFAGSGVHISRTTGEYVKGSPLSVLSVSPQFSEYHFVELDPTRAATLRELTANDPKVKVYEGDCNEILPNQIFGRARYEDHARALCMLDPYGLHLDWKVIETAGKMRSVEVFLNFSIMDMNMNVLKHDKASVDLHQMERMDQFWGDRSWYEAAYSSPQTNLFGESEKGNNEAVVAAYRERLQKIAGFKYVPDPIPMKNKGNVIVYYLFFASNNKVGTKIARFIFNKYRDKAGTP